MIKLKVYTFIFYILIPLSIYAQMREFFVGFSEDAEINITTNSSFVIILEEEGWIYLRSNSPLVKFRNETYENGKTKFFFQTLGIQGFVSLEFAFQNLKKALSFSKFVKVIIKNSTLEDDFIDETNESLKERDEKYTREEIDNILLQANNLKNIKDFDGALSILEAYDVERDDYIYEKAKLYYDNQNYLKAFENFLKLNERGNIDKDIKHYLINSAIKIEKALRVIELIREVVQKGEKLKEELYLDVLEFLLGKREYKFADNIKDLYDIWYVEKKFNLDKYIYLLALFYESESEYKDIIKAIKYYDLIKKNYPFSTYYRSAYNRSLYLKRFIS